MYPSYLNSALEVDRDNEHHLYGLEMLERDVKLEDCRGGASGVEEVGGTPRRKVFIKD